MATPGQLTSGQITYLNKLRVAEKEARERRVAYEKKLAGECDHSLTLHDCWGGEDTLGNWDEKDATHVWQCALCGFRLDTHQGRLDITSLPKSHPRWRELDLPYGLGLANQILANAPQTAEDIERFIAEEVELAEKAKARGYSR